MFYDGHPAPEPGAVVCRVAPSFLRFGNFQIHAAKNEPEQLKQLVDYTVKNFYPGLSYEEFFHEVCRRTANLMVDWMRLGFVHGVMNTDNMSILGLTIDYGPYGWLEGFDTQWTPNTTDAPTLRYIYGNQAGIAQWNLARLAESLVSLMDGKHLEDGLTLFADTFQEGWNRALAAKLGLPRSSGRATRRWSAACSARSPPPRPTSRFSSGTWRRRSDDGVAAAGLLHGPSSGRPSRCVAPTVPSTAQGRIRRAAGTGRAE